MALTQEQQNVKAGFDNVAADVSLIKRTAPTNAKDAAYNSFGNGVHDDAPNLQAAFLGAGTNELYIPAGTYICSTALVLANTGAVTIKGAGSGKTKLIFTGAGGGISLSNPVGGNLGLLKVEGISIICGATKNAGSVGLYMAAQHECQPGIILNDVVITNDGSHEWPIHLHYQDSSVTNFDKVKISGVNLNTGTVGVKISNTTSGTNNTVGRPCVNHSLNGIDILGVGMALLVEGKGAPGIEGVNIKGLRAVAVGSGVDISTKDYGATWLSFSHCHVECFGGKALRVSGFIQTMFDGTNLWYVHGSPSSAIELNNVIGVTGDLGQIVTFDLVPYAVEIMGTGGAIDIRYKHTPSNGGSRDLKIASGFLGSRVNIERNWSGAVGPETSDPVTDLSNTSRISGTPERAQAVGVIVGGNLDLQRVYSPLVVINPDQTGPIVNVFMRYQQQVTIRFNTPMTVQNNTGIWLKGRADSTFQPFETVTLYRSVDNVEEVSRNTLSALTRVVELTANYTFTLADLGKSFLVSAQGITATVPKDKLPIGWWCKIWNNHNIAGATIVAPENGVSINYNTNRTKIAGPFRSATLECLSGNWFGLDGPNVTT